MRLSHIHEDDKSQADSLEVRIVVKNDVSEELPEPDNPLDNTRDEFGNGGVIVSISVEIWHNTKGKLTTHTGTFNSAVGYNDEDGYREVSRPFSRHDYNLHMTEGRAVALQIVYDAWYTMYYADDWGVTPEDLDDNWTRLDPEDDQWLNRPMRSEFTLTWDQFMDIARRLWPSVSEKEWTAFWQKHKYISRLA